MQRRTVETKPPPVPPPTATAAHQRKRVAMSWSWRQGSPGCSTPCRSPRLLSCSISLMTCAPLPIGDFQLLASGLGELAVRLDQIVTAAHTPALDAKPPPGESASWMKHWEARHRRGFGRRLPQLRVTTSSTLSHQLQTELEESNRRNGNGFSERRNRAARLLSNSSQYGSGLAILDTSGPCS